MCLNLDLGTDTKQNMCFKEIKLFVQTTLMLYTWNLFRRLAKQRTT